ncbi:hypothetical protein IDH12_00235 [Pelagibacterales bacterium SAG-MED29]|nr:hypothetical protein [Pelagibacterales bacterium SAG-MED29]
MKVFLSVLILIFSLQSWTKADDIRNFQVEGLSIGDSALTILSQDEIKEYKRFIYNQKDYYSVAFSLPSFKVYEYVQLNIKSGDQKFIIDSIEGGFITNYKECKKKKNIIANELKSTFPNLKFAPGKELVQKNVRKETSSYLFFNTSFLDGGVIRVMCTEWSKQTKDTKGWQDSLRVVINSKEFNHFLDKEY